MKRLSWLPQWILNSITSILIGTWIHKLFWRGQPNPSSFLHLSFSPHHCLSRVDSIAESPSSWKKKASSSSRKAGDHKNIIPALGPSALSAASLGGDKGQRSGPSLIPQLWIHRPFSDEKKADFSHSHPSLLPKLDTVRLCSGATRAVQRLLTGQATGNEPKGESQLYPESDNRIAMFPEHKDVRD